uniref:substrate-binding domain-containing protein n=1 Tax=Streptomyces caniscabiei TaxID=2746961 RepID=UPI0011809111
VATALAGARPDTPLVMLDNGLGDGTPVVSSDFTAGARLATGHLLDLGHPTVWHIAGPTGWTSADMRAASWRETLREAGARVHEPLVGDWSADSGYALGRRLAARPEITAVFVSNDQMALGLLRALHEAGRRVPDDVSVVGYDDIPEAAHLLPPLTTIRTDFPEIGRRALRLLLTQLDDPEDAGEALERDPVIPVELIVRNSTGAAR